MLLPSFCFKEMPMTRSIDIEALCAEKGLRITEQRRTLAKKIGLGTKRKRTAVKK